MSYIVLPCFDKCFQKLFILRIDTTINSKYDTFRLNMDLCEKWKHIVTFS